MKLNTKLKIQNSKKKRLLVLLRRKLHVRKVKGSI